MNEAETIALVLIVLAVSAYCVMSFKHQQKKKRWSESRRVWQEKREKELARWQNKLNSAKRYLIGSDWTKPDGKEAFIQEVFGEDVPKYLWYLLGECFGKKAITDSDIATIRSCFYMKGDIKFGDLEYHGNKLRIRNPERLQAELLGCPLVQVGYSHSGAFEPGVINFQDKSLYKGFVEPEAF